MEAEQANPNSKNQSKKRKKISEFEFCEVCKLNHDQGQRHKYFPAHKKSLSIFFSRFQTKLSDVRFFLVNPSLLRPEHASRNRLWCVFCNKDMDELGSSFAWYELSLFFFNFLFSVWIERKWRKILDRKRIEMEFLLFLFRQVLNFSFKIRNFLLWRSFCFFVSFHFLSNQAMQ